MFELIQSIIKEALDHNLKIVEIMMSKSVNDELSRENEGLLKSDTGEHNIAEIMDIPVKVRDTPEKNDYVALMYYERNDKTINIRVFAVKDQEVR